MAYVTVPKDLTKIKSKVMFNLTKRQLICFSAAVAIGLPLFFLVKDSVGTTTAALCMVLAMLPMFLLAMYEKNGQPLEVIIRQFVEVKFLRPKERPYQTNNFYAALARQEQLDKEVRAIVKGKKNTQNEKRKLSRQERKQIDTLIRQAKGDGKPHTAQDSIPFERMYKDGICRLANGRYSKCIEFEDINYQLAQPDDKTAIFEALCDMYNSFDASISVQLSLISRHANKDDFKNSITIAPQNDDFDSIRAEYTEMLRTQLERGNNGLIKTKFLTFTVEAKDIRSARARLARIETDTLNHFKVIGAAARVLDGKQRLEVLHGIFHPDGERFNFAWEWLPASGLSVKDFIAPSSFRFGDGRMFQMGGKFGAVSFLQIVAPELSDRMLADFMDAENGIIVNLHIQSIDHNEAIKTIKRKITDLDRMKIEEQKKAIRSGYDMDIIPSDLATYGGEAKNLLRDLQSRNERMFLLTLLVLNLADTKQKLDNEVFGAAAIAQKYNCILTRLDYRQEQGLMSSIPLGENLIHIQRGLTTSSTAVFVPFTCKSCSKAAKHCITA